ncbi:MAG: Hsp70 family protein [Proteobacteria bacterium]|nr:Hsp70 family protein [Pseudomonadota bacterium]
MIGVGIDFGTSNSAAAWYDGEQVRLVQLESDDAIMPSATHLNRDLETKTGRQAVLQYIEENRDRIVELTPEVIGKSSIVTSDAALDDPYSEAEIATVNVYGQPWVDRGMPGRLFRGVKRLLGNASVNRLLVFDHPFRVVALITPVLLRIREAIDSCLPKSAHTVHFGHPVLFEGNEHHRNDLAFARLEEACTHAGIEKLTFYPEPVAATLSYLYEENTHSSGRVLTLDFGGGTLDLSVVEFRGVDFDVLSTAGMSLGGDHIDQLIFRELLFPLLGKGEIWSRITDGRLIENEFPFEEFEDKLLNWAVTYMLNQNHYRAKVADRIKQGGPAAVKFERLEDLIAHNYSYLVFQAIKDAKARLSTVEETILDIPELDLAITFTRERFEAMMGNMLRQIDEILTRVLEEADCTADDIDVVIRTGGSSQIAAVKQRLEERFPGRVTEHDPFTSVAAGLAIASYHGYEFHDGRVPGPNM